MQDRTQSAKQILDDLSRGLDDLYEVYRKRKEATAASYAQAKNALDPEYQILKDRASVQSKIAQANTDRRMVEKGLEVSGEAIRSEGLNQSALQQNLTNIDLERQAKKTALDTEQRQKEADLAAEEQAEISKYVYQMNQTYYDRLDAENQLQLKKDELALKKEAELFDQKIKEEELALKKRQQAFEEEAKRALSEEKKKEATAANSAVGGTLTSGLTPITGTEPKSFDAKELADEIFKRHLSKNAYGQSVYDADAIRKELNFILKDNSLSADFRKELSLYARSRGFL